MPFTFSHPAIVLPLTKIHPNKLSATGLIIGSMAPDFEYFIKMKMEKVHGHTLEGIFYFDLPLTIVLAFIFHLFVRDQLINNLPNSLNHKLLRFTQINWLQWVKKRWYVLIYSSLIGIFSHLCWDAFTHTNGFFVRHIPILQGWIDISGVLVRKTDLLQLLSTIFGGLFILTVLVLPKHTALNTKLIFRKVKFWLLVSLITILILILRNGDSTGDFVATFIAGGLIGIIGASLLFRQSVKL